MKTMMRGFAFLYLSAAGILGLMWIFDLINLDQFPGSLKSIFAALTLVVILGLAWNALKADAGNSGNEESPGHLR